VRRLAILPFTAGLLCAQGCGTLWNATFLARDADKALLAGKYRECIAYSTKAMEKYQTLVPESGNRHWMGVDGVSFSLVTRGDCKKKSGDVQGALSDLEEGLKLRMLIIREGPYTGKIKQTYETEAADMAERLAQWKKETKK
jgi:hypothetical protein